MKHILIAILGIPIVFRIFQKFQTSKNIYLVTHLELISLLCISFILLNVLSNIHCWVIFIITILLGISLFHQKNTKLWDRWWRIPFDGSTDNRNYIFFYYIIHNQIWYILFETQDVSWNKLPIRPSCGQQADAFPGSMVQT